MLGLGNHSSINQPQNLTSSKKRSTLPFCAQGKV
jgi:hypothetical protein